MEQGETPVRQCLRDAVAMLGGARGRLLQGTGPLDKISEEPSASASDRQTLHIRVRDEAHLFVQQTKVADKL